MSPLAESMARTAAAKTQYRLTLHGAYALAIAFVLTAIMPLVGVDMVPFVAMVWALLAVAALALKLNLDGITLTCRCSPTAFAKGPLPIRIDLQRDRGRPRARDILVDISLEKNRFHRLSWVRSVSDQQKTRVEVEGRAPSRGQYKELVIQLRTTFPFRWLERTTRVTLPIDLLVYPRLLTVAHHLDGQGPMPRALRWHDGMEDLKGFHIWRPGEGTKHVHWKLSARRGERIVREYRCEESPPVHIVLAAKTKTFTREHPSFERALSLAAGLVVHYASRRQRVKFSTCTKEPLRLVCRPGFRGAIPVLSHLALLEPQEAASGKDPSFSSREHVLWIDNEKGKGPRTGTHIDVEDEDVARRLSRPQLVPWTLRDRL